MVVRKSRGLAAHVHSKSGTGQGTHFNLYAVFILVSSFVSVFSILVNWNLLRTLSTSSMSIVDTELGLLQPPPPLQQSKRQQHTQQKGVLEGEDDFDFNFNFNATGLKLLYLHVGKTGGTTLDKVLRSNCKYNDLWEPNEECWRELLGGGDRPDEELLISRVTERTMHIFLPPMRQIKKQYSSHLFLWTLRNPITRAVSSLDMRNVHNNPYNRTVDFWQEVFYRHCGFGTAQDLADALEFETTNTTNTKASSSSRVIRIPASAKSQKMIDFDCRKFAKDTLEGHGDEGHMLMNYAYYSRVTNKLPKNGNFVVRTEHLWDDLIQTNELLVRANVTPTTEPPTSTGTETITPLVDSQQPKEKENSKETTDWMSNVKKISTHTATHGSEGWKVRSKLTQRGKEIFCCYLSEENQIYEDLLQSAVNLSDRQKAQSLATLYRDCGILPPLGMAPTRSNTPIPSSMDGGFGWKEWQSRGCPRYAALAATATAVAS